ncbi:MAG: YciI family protein [Nitrosomonas sp.]|nr:MAG: YciI family protein [Nitrosomonas sp.]
MKYLCLVYSAESLLDAIPDSDCLNYDEQIRKSGHCLASEALQPVHTATTVRVRDSKISITDGPFAETKEQLAGFYLIEAEHLDEAIQLAAKIPPAQIGSIEIRPIRPIREMAKQNNRELV